MNALARAYKIEEIEENPKLAEKATKQCFGCDEDNPKRVPRIACKLCKGTGRQKLAACDIAAELKESKKKIRQVEDEDDMNLEY